MADMNDVILVFGTFNPVTNAHIGMGRAAQRVLPEARVIYIPSNGRFLHSWKNLDEKNTLSDAERAGLLRQAGAPFGFEVDTLEMDGTVDGKTYHTVEYFKKKGYNVYVCMGMDKVPEFELWYYSEELLRENRFLICTRNHTHIADVATPLVQKYMDHFQEVPMDCEMQEISATQVREAYLNGTLEQVRDKIPDCVYTFLSGDRQLTEPADGQDRKEKLMEFDVAKVTEDLVAWLQNWFDKNGKGCNAVVGISGGKDSSVVAALCVKALGKDRVIGVLMPNHEQSDISDAKLLCSTLGIKNYIVNIGAAVDALKDSIAVATDGAAVSDQTRINMPPRIRMTTLYAVSQSVNGRVINTCNLSEDWVGYSTKYGDAAGDVSPLANLTVTEVKAVGKYLGLPIELVDKAPSDGLCGKTDEDNLGFTYATLDKYIRTGVCEDPATKELIDRKHRNNLFKLQLMQSFPYGNRMGYITSEE